MSMCSASCVMSSNLESEQPCWRISYIGVVENMGKKKISLSSPSPPPFDNVLKPTPDAEIPQKDKEKYQEEFEHFQQELDKKKEEFQKEHPDVQGQPGK